LGRQRSSRQKTRPTFRFVDAEILPGFLSHRETRSTDQHRLPGKKALLFLPAVDPDLSLTEREPKSPMIASRSADDSKPLYVA
jgi:hypothetical protein